VLFAELFLAALASYAVVGAMFAIAFLVLGIHRVDPVAEHAPVGFRLIVMPGVAALWPLLLAKWMASASRRH
jgi:hypothetical protein